MTSDIKAHPDKELKLPLPAAAVEMGASGAVPHADAPPRSESAQNRETYAALVKAFLGFLEYRGRSPATIQGYRGDLRRLEPYLESQPKGFPTPEEITRPLLQQYLMDLKAKGAQANSILRVMSSIRSFFKYLTNQTERIEHDPSRGLLASKVPQRVPVVLSREQIDKLLNLPDETTWDGLRDRAFLSTFCFLGLRLAELAGLELEHYDPSPNKPTLRVIGKGDKERVLPVNSDLRRALDRYIEVRPPSHSQALFLSINSRTLNKSTIRKKVKSYGQKIGVTITSHKLRHSFATALHEADVDIVEIQGLLGHSSIRSTQIYTHSSPHRLRSAVDKLG